VKALDLCCGVGGQSLGLRRAGMQVMGVDLDEDAVAAHVANVGPASVGDVRELQVAERYAVVAAGVPCQPHSEQGSKRGLADDRGRLHEHVVRIANSVGAQALILENVPGIAHARRGLPAAIESVVETVRVGGFHGQWRVLDAADYGTPQHRPRVVLVAFRSAQVARGFRWPEPSHGQGRAPYVTVRAALGLKGSFRSGGRHLPVTWWQGSRRIDVDAPSFTIGTRNNADWICPVVGEAWRPQLEELALLQGFPVGFRFHGLQAAKHRQMGNALPPQLAQAVGMAVASALSGERIAVRSA